MLFFECDSRHARPLWVRAGETMIALAVGLLLGVCAADVPVLVFGSTVTAGVTLVGATLWFRRVSERVKRRSFAWTIMLLSAAVPGWLISMAIDNRNPGLSLAVSLMMAAVATLWFVQDMWMLRFAETDRVRGEYEWTAAWLLHCDVILLIISLMRAGGNRLKGRMR